MQRVWAWTQCIAIDASVAGTIIRTFRYHAEGERVKTWLYGLLSALLFTAAIVSNIESVQQTLNIALDKVRDVAKALVISVSTANKWMIRIRGAQALLEAVSPRGG